MDHPFLTRRDDIARVGCALELAADLRTLASMTKDDHAHVLARREPLVADESVKKALSRHSGCLGMLLEYLDERADTALSTAYAKEWAGFLQSATPPPDALWTALDETAARLCSLREKLAPMEADEASSSYSDYSDSRTVSSDDEKDSGSEEEEEEDDSPPKKRRGK